MKPTELISPATVAACREVPTHADLDYWHFLIDERAAGDFLGLTDRTMQQFRQRGGGPRFVRVSARCVRYTRAALKAWADARVRTSTSDPGPETQAA